MDRLFKSATNAITALTALAWLVAAVLGLSEQAALALGFIPGRLSGAAVPWPALPAILTPLSATLVHSGLVHLGFNLLVFVWCGMAVERVLGMAGLIVLYLVGAYAAALTQWALDPSAMVPMIGASGAISAVIGAFALSFGRPRMFTRSPLAQPLDQRDLADGRVGRASADDGLARGRAGLSAGDPRARRRLRRGAAAPAPAAAVAVPEGLGRLLRP